jgi:hypothetical protein
MKIRKLFAPILVTVLLALTLPAACSRAAEYCDMRCECELCNDREFDLCVIDKDSDLDTAAAYECADEYDKYHDCRLDRSDCDDYNWSLDGDDCADDHQDYLECVEDSTGYTTSSSSTSTSSSSSNGQGGGECNTTCSCPCECGTATVTATEGCLQPCELECVVACAEMCPG